MPYINALNDFINMNINNDNSRNNDKNKNNASPSSQVNALETFVVGGVAGIASKTVSAPLERVKLLIQNQEEMIKQVNRRGIDQLNSTIRVVSNELLAVTRVACCFSSELLVVGTELLVISRVACCKQ